MQPDLPGLPFSVLSVEHYSRPQADLYAPTVLLDLIAFVYAAVFYQVGVHGVGVCWVYCVLGVLCAEFLVCVVLWVCESVCCVLVCVLLLYVCVLWVCCMCVACVFMCLRVSPPCPFRPWSLPH